MTRFPFLPAAMTYAFAQELIDSEYVHVIGCVYMAAIQLKVVFSVMRCPQGPAAVVSLSHLCQLRPSSSCSKQDDMCFSLRKMNKIAKIIKAKR